MYLESIINDSNGAIKMALTFLASQCDGANRIDGAGFNKFDAAAGRVLAQMIESGVEPSFQQLNSALTMLQKYRSQLEAANIYLPDRVAPSKPTLKPMIVDEEVSGRSKKFVDDGQESEPIEVEAVVVIDEGKGVLPTDGKIVNAFPRDDRAELYEFIGSQREKALQWKQQEPWKQSKYREPLSEQQKLAFDLAHEWFFIDGGVSPFLLKGYAGTGKSFTAQRILLSIKEFSKKYIPHHSESRGGFRVCLGAPTQKAARVLRDMGSRAGLSAHVDTMHSLLHLGLGKRDKYGRQPLERIGYSSDPHLADYDLGVMDEGSMVHRDLYAFFEPLGVPIIWMGDPAQLPPVESRDTEESDGKGRFEPPDPSPVFGLGNGIELTEVVRYEGAIAKFVGAIRSDIDRVDVPTIPNRDNVMRFYGNENNWLDELVVSVKEAIERDDDDLVRAISWTNSAMKDSNKFVRAAIYGEYAEDYVNGERLIVKEAVIKPVLKTYQGQAVPYRKIIGRSCDEFTVLRANRSKLTRDAFDRNGYKEGVDRSGKPQTFALYRCPLELGNYFNPKEGFDIYELTVRDVGGDRHDLIVPDLHMENHAMLSKLFGDWGAWIREQDKESRGKHWNAFYEAQEDLCMSILRKDGPISRLQYGYAITAHQSQGSTYKHVFLNTDDIMRCRTIRTRNQLLYVAASRASEILFAK